MHSISFIRSFIFHLISVQSFITRFKLYLSFYWLSLFINCLIAHSSCFPNSRGQEKSHSVSLSESWKTLYNAPLRLAVAIMTSPNAELWMDRARISKTIASCDNYRWEHSWKTSHVVSLPWLAKTRITKQRPLWPIDCKIILGFSFDICLVVYTCLQMHSIIIIHVMTTSPFLYAPSTH